jgi:hypothetical protein
MPTLFTGNEPLPAQATEEQAVDFLVDLLRKDFPLRAYGYAVYLRRVIEEYLFTVGQLPRNQPVAPRWIEEISPAFFSAAWSLCRLGVLRPGVQHFGAQSVGDLQGYALTTFGQQWLKESHDSLLIPADSNRTTSMLLAVGGKFGAAFGQRAREASLCYTAHAFLACCSMVGAAAEAILLSAAAAKLGEDDALAIYKSGAGRAKLQTRLLGSSSDWLRREFNSHTDLISYWRNQAAHGHGGAISESEALMALRGLLRFSQIANDNWQELIATGDG